VIGGHGHVDLGCTDINSGGMGLQDGQDSLILALSFLFGHGRITLLELAKGDGPGCAS